MRRLLLILTLLMMPELELAQASYSRDASGQLTYYLLKENFSVAGTGNADGSTIAQSDYSSTGDFAGAAGGGIDVDYDDDTDVDADDFDDFAACHSGPNVPQSTPSCADKKLDFDSDVDQDDFGIFQECFSGAGNTAAPECRGQGPATTTGDFVMHGRPVDVLADGHTLLYVRARYYDLKNGRWLQRNPLDYADGSNLYEAFLGNSLRFQDAFGEEVIKDVDKLSLEQIEGRKWQDVLETLLASSSESRNGISISDRSRLHLVHALVKKNAGGFDWYELGWNAVKFAGKDPSRVSDIDLMDVGHNITMRLNQERVHADTKRIQRFAGSIFILASNVAVTAATGPLVGALGEVVFAGPELGAGAGLVSAGTMTRGPAVSAAEEIFFTVPRVQALPRLQFGSRLPYDLPYYTSQQTLLAGRPVGWVKPIPKYDVNTPWYRYLKPQFGVEARVVEKGRSVEAILATKAHEGRHIGDVLNHPQLTYLATKKQYFPGSGLARYWFEYRGYSAGGQIESLLTPLRSFTTAQKWWLGYDVTVFGGGTAGAIYSNLVPFPKR